MSSSSSDQRAMRVTKWKVIFSLLIFLRMNPEGNWALSWRQPLMHPNSNLLIVALVSRYLTLWRYVRVVADWVTFILGCLCCQCLNNMPFEVTPGSVGSKSSIEAPQIISQTPAVDSDRVCGEPFRRQHLVIDFHQQPGDNEGVAQKCNEFWDFVRSQSALDGMLVTPDVACETRINDETTSKRKLKNDTRVDEYPAIHVLKRLNKIG